MFTLKLNGKIKCCRQTEKDIIKEIEKYLETNTLQELYVTNIEITDINNNEYIIYSTDIEEIKNEKKILWR